MRRTMLFLPGNNPRMIMNGGVLGSDSIIFDLEDAVSPDDKDAARILVRRALEQLKFGTCEIVVRINGLDTSYWEEDLEQIIPCRPNAVMLPKVDGADYIRKAENKIAELEEKEGIPAGEVKIIPLLETALGIEKAYEIATAGERVAALCLGAEDLAADLGCQRTKEGTEIAYARARILLAAKAAGVDACDTPFTDVEDMEGLEQDTRYAKQLGYTGKLLISPRHVDCVNQMFCPAVEEVQYAREVMEVIEQGKREGKGAVSLRGKMIDAPIAERARKVLEMAEKLGGVKI